MWDRVVPVHILMGRDGLYGIRNRDRIPLGGVIQLQNATLEDNTLRTAGGADPLGDAITDTPAIKGAIDYWPVTATQRTVVMTSAGKLMKDDGSGAGWTELLTGLTTSGAVPVFTAGGGEVLSNNRLLFYADGVNQERVLTADGAAFAALASPPADWAGSNRPRAFVIHEGYNWGFGNANAPHLLYRSLNTNHQDFLTTRFAVPIFSGQGEYLVAGISYKGGILLFKYPEGVFWYDTRNADTTEWRAYQTGSVGCAGPNCVCLVEDDVVFLDPFGGLHLISATTATGSVRASDLSPRKLGRYIPDQINRQALGAASLVYYSDKQQVLVALPSSGQSKKNRLLTLDLGNKAEVGERWAWGDRDVNEALFMRKKNGVLIPAIGDDAGQLWELDRVTRNKDGAGYTFAWWLADNDFDKLVPGWAGKMKNLWYAQLLYDARSAASHSLQVWRDGRHRQTISMTLSGGAAALPVTLPVTLGAETMLSTIPRRMRGQARRLAIRGVSTEANADVSIAGLVLGVTLAGGT